MGTELRLGLLGLVSVGVGCSFIDGFDFEVGDAGAPGDAGAGDGGPMGSCDPPCLGDATEDFADTQGAGALQWRYLNDTREADGLAYGELASSQYLGAPAWTDLTPPPAIVDCRASDAAACDAGGLLFEANGPGDGSDPVLSFVAPEDGTYAVVLDAQGVSGAPLLRVSRQSRHDTVSDAVGTITSFNPTLDLFAGERGLITVGPSASGPAAMALSVRVSEVVAAAPLASCELALRFSESEPFAVDCASGSITEEGTVDSTPTDGPSDEYGTARSFRVDQALRIGGVRNDYSGDFTLQMWVRIDSLNYFSTAFYSDWSAADAMSAGGVSFGLDPRSDDETVEDIITVGYLFPLPDVGAPAHPSIDCDADSCGGSIVAQYPTDGAWHFYRVVRDASAEEVRLCIDGRLVGTGWLGSGIDVSNSVDPKLGTYGFGAPTFEGAIDDVRAFSVALPCE